MAKNTKTPVMLLQELTVKRNYDPPEYNLVYSVQGTHENQFHYEVCVHNVSAKGKGRSKKEAKHEAAHLVLQLLAEEGICHPDESATKNVKVDNRTETSPLKPPLNCIPKLMDMCFENKIPTPEFIEISAVGPPHCREFTYECHVASLTTRAIAGSKKHAKQMTANEMLEKIISVLPELQDQCESWHLKLMDTEDEVVERFVDLSKFSSTKINFNARVVDYNLQLKNLINEKQLKLDEIMEYFLLPQDEDTLERLLNLFELKFNFEIIQEHPPVIVIAVNTDTPLSLIEAGKNLTDTRERALDRIFSVLRTFLE